MKLDVRLGHRTAALCLLVLSSVAACSSKATQEQCEKMANHIIDAMNREMGEVSRAQAKPLMDSLRTKHIEGCVGKTSASELDCVMKAKTDAEIQKCWPVE